MTFLGATFVLRLPLLRARESSRTPPGKPGAALCRSSADRLPCIPLRATHHPSRRERHAAAIGTTSTFPETRPHELVVVPHCPSLRRAGGVRVAVAEPLAARAG